MAEHSARLPRALWAVAAAARLTVATVATVATLANVAGAAAQTGGTSTLQDPVVTFSTPGIHTVTLTTCNATGCSSLSHQVMVLDPVPAISSQSAVPAQVYAGQPIFLAGQATGQPVLGYTWQVLQGTTQVQALSGQNIIWSTAGLPAGTYSLQLTVANTAGTIAALVPVTLLAATGTNFYTVTPCRALDTRLLAAPLIAGAAARVFPIAGTCGVPAGARAVAVNVTAVAPTSGGYVAVFPGDYTQPFVGSVSFAAGTTQADFAVLPLSSDGLGDLAAVASLSGTGQVDLLLDVSGYFGP
jgi:PKD repeat protein